MTIPITTASDALKKGGIICLLDDAAPQPRLYLVSAGSLTTEDTISVMVNEGRGIICAAISETRLKELGLTPMGPKNRHQGVDFSVSVEAREGVSTGISSADRAKTLQMLAITTEPKRDLVTPGHIFPIRAKSGGVLVRSDASEAAVDLVTNAGLPPVATLCHVLDEAGRFPAPDSVIAIAAQLTHPLVAITDIIRYRLGAESIVELIASAKLPTGYAGEFQAYCFLSRTDQAEHLALVKGDLGAKDADGKQLPVLVRVQAEHRFSDLLGMNDLLGLQRIRGALTEIAKRGRGVFVYVRHPRKGALSEQAAALRGEKPSVQASGPAGELRENGIGAQILVELGIKRIELLTNSARDLSSLSAFNLELVDRLPFEPVDLPA